MDNTCRKGGDVEQRREHIGEGDNQLDEDKSVMGGHRTKLLRVFVLNQPRRQITTQEILIYIHIDELSFHTAHPLFDDPSESFAWYVWSFDGQLDSSLSCQRDLGQVFRNREDQRSS